MYQIALAVPTDPAWAVRGTFNARRMASRVLLSRLSVEGGNLVEWPSCGGTGTPQGICYRGRI